MAWAFACDDGPLPPVACSSFPQQTVTVGDEIPLDLCFEDPEMGTLTLTAESSNPEVATGEILGDEVWIAGVSPGTAAITVTATDPDMMTAELAIEVLVPNRPPQLRKEIPPFYLKVGPPADERVLSEYFFDPDDPDGQQQLTYGATSSDTTVVSVALSADTLAVIGVSTKDTANVTVTATDADGLSDTVQVDALVRALPGAPTQLNATLYSNEHGITDSVGLTWTAPADDGGTPLTSYGIEWRHLSHDPDEWVHLGNTINATVTAATLTSGLLSRDNFFRVRAVNAIGAGYPSNIDSVYVVVPTSQEPPRFTGRNLTESEDEVYIQWEPSPNDESTSDIAYWFIVSSNNGGAWEYHSAPSPEERGLKVGWPELADSMRFRIRAAYWADLGDWSNVVRFSWGGPDRPDSLKATADGDSVVVLTWTAPADTGNSAITGYMIETSSEGGRNWRYLVPNTGSTRTTYRHGNLTGGSTHLYVVSAITETGIGPPSTVAGATIQMNLNAPRARSPIRSIRPKGKWE